MKKKVKIVMLPTEKTSHLFLKSKGLEFNIIPPLHGIRDLGWKYQNMYIVSDDAIKEEEYGIDKTENEVFQTTKGWMGFKKENYFKIIASTDSELGLPSISSADLQYIVEEYNKNRKLPELEIIMERKLTEVGKCEMDMIEKSNDTYPRNTPSRWYDIVPKIKNDGSVSLTIENWDGIKKDLISLLKGINPEEEKRYTKTDVINFVRLAFDAAKNEATTASKFIEENVK